MLDHQNEFHMTVDQEIDEIVKRTTAEMVKRAKAEGKGEDIKDEDIPF
jgi:hypothetical protein